MRPAMMRPPARASRGSPGFGVSATLPATPAAIRDATAPGNFAAARDARVQPPRRLHVEGSATPGPEPMTERSSPTTSEIAKRERRSSACCGELPALDAREMLAQRVQLLNISPAAHRAIDRRPLVVERDAVRWKREQRRRAAGQEEQQHVRLVPCAAAIAIARLPASTLRSSGSGCAAVIHWMSRRQLHRSMRPNG